MEGKIKNVSDMNISASPWGFAWRIMVVIFVFAVLDSGIIFLGSASNAIKATATFYVMLIIASALAGGFFSWILASRFHRRLQIGSYLQYLQRLEHSDLISASKSPELAQESQDLIVSYLNRNAPGWSFK